MKRILVDAFTKMPLKKALKFMTDDWIEGNNYCDQTVIDLRDACTDLLKRLEKPRFVTHAMRFKGCENRKKD